MCLAYVDLGLIYGFHINLYTVYFLYMVNN